MLKKGLRVGGLKLNEPLEIAGVNSIAELEALEKEYLRRIKTKNI
jgi:bifunctional N-acetylglucosamine-1-phosphate-uridyltransferase/glucosamine-1-phosphate-acetyltransferase GlmU-like protein